MDIVKDDNCFVVTLDFESAEARREIVKRLLENEKIKKELSDFNSAFSVKIKNATGGAVVLFQKENLKFGAHTFILPEKTKKEVIIFLKNADVLKNASLYLYKDKYILEIVLSTDSPILARLSDMAKKIRLSDSHDFLRLFCKRLEL